LQLITDRRDATVMDMFWHDIAWLGLSSFQVRLILYMLNYICENNWMATTDANQMIKRHLEVQQ
jgi:hypothetical protein